LHPLDDGLVDWARIVRQMATQWGVAERVAVIDGGAIETVLRDAAAVVTVNSTAGMTALAQGVPLMALGDAIYDLPGLTFQGKLDELWSKATPPNPQLYDAFRRVLAARCLISGGFFSEAGIGLAVHAAVNRLGAAEPQPRRADIAEDDTLVETGAFAISTAAE
jgi:capsular polysaccharide export protein